MEDSPRLTTTAGLRGGSFCIFRLPGNFFLFPSELIFDTLFIVWTEAMLGKAPCHRNDYWCHL